MRRSLGDIAVTSVLAVTAFGAANAEPQTAPAPPAAAPVIYEALFTPILPRNFDFGELGRVGPYWPERALRNNMTHCRIALQCKAHLSGVLTDCKAISEMPDGYNFGVAAEVMARRKRVIVAGVTQEGAVIQVHVPFELMKPAPAAH